MGANLGSDRRGKEMSLWNPSKPLNQPPNFGRVGAVSMNETKPITPAEQTAINAMYDSQSGRRDRCYATAFDRSTKGSR